MSDPTFACVYFRSDKTVNVIPKSKCTLAGDAFQQNGTVAVQYYHEGESQRCLGTILQVSTKQNKRYLENYAKDIQGFIRNSTKKSVEFTLQDLIRRWMPCNSQQHQYSDNPPLKKKRLEYATSGLILGEDSKNVAKARMKKNEDRTNQTKTMKQSSNDKIDATNVDNILTPQARQPTANNAINSHRMVTQETQHLQETQPWFSKQATPQTHSSPPDKANFEETASEFDNDLKCLSGPANGVCDENLSDSVPEILSDVNNDDITEINGVDEKEGLRSRVKRLEKENAKLKLQLRRHRLPEPPSEVIAYFKKCVQLAEGNFGGSTISANFNAAVASYVVQANLKPRQGQVRLLKDHGIYVPGNKLHQIICEARRKGPLHLVQKLVPLVFTTAELANSRGQGLNHRPQDNCPNKKPLDPTKIQVLKDYLSTFCAENGKECPHGKQINETLTQQVSYARRKRQQLEAKSDDRHRV